MMLAVPKTSVDGHVKPFFWLLEQISGIFVNIHAWTPSCVVPAMTVAMT